MNEFITKNMIQVTMGIQEHDGLKRLLTDEIGQFFSLLLKITTRINDDAFFFFIEKQVGILLQGVETENFNVYHSD